MNRVQHCALSRLADNVLKFDPESYDCRLAARIKMAGGSRELHAMQMGVVHISEFAEMNYSDVGIVIEDGNEEAAQKELAGILEGVLRCRFNSFFVRKVCKNAQHHHEGGSYFYQISWLATI